MTKLERRKTGVHGTALSHILLEKSSVSQPLKNFSTFYLTRKFITVFTRACHWSLA
jgi:hypothetical protein